ncbi:MAG: DUF839 domain-containing protein [Rubrivivax sp.]|nr:DUF839 domain-containing protein [Rubrivivax sp.]
MNKPIDLPLCHKLDENSNTSANPSFDQVLSARMSRRGLLRSGGAASMAAMLGSFGLAACGGDDDDEPTAVAPTETLLGFTAVAKSVADAFAVPTGYTATTLIAVGDPLFAGVPAYKNDGTDADYDKRCGEWHDGMEYFGLSAAGARDDASNDRALLGINHEWVTTTFLHVNGPSPAPRPASEVDIEVACMGVSVVEIAKGSDGRFAYVQGSSFNRRITTLTEIEFAGPARGHAKLRTKFSPAGTKTRGTINNCGTGKTPWGTLLTGEENWTNFFARNAGDGALRTANENFALTRYGRNPGAGHAYSWNTVASADDKYARWNTSVTGTTADGSDDYRHEINGQGYVTEIDCYNPTSVVKKRTTMGRMAHEGAAFGKLVAGEPLAIYMGDDARAEYIYKFVSEALWNPADANATDRMAVGDKYLDRGKLYAAKFNDDGSGTWVELSMANPAVAGYANYAFADDGDVLIHARIAADAAGATKMDRPEWGNVNPANGEIYITLTNNSNRRLAPTGSQLPLDAANPRAYSDIRGGTTVLNGNVNGHIMRMKDANATATSFAWDIYLFGAESDADGKLVNLSGLTDDQDFSSPDGLVFTGSTGLCWFQTDDSALEDESNCMMLAAIPGEVGDGAAMTLDYGSRQVTTHMGKKPTASTLKRFLVGPVEQEITGLVETPDGKVMFINVQHPGSDTSAANIADPSKYTSHWPGNAGYGAGGANARPRSATVMIVKNDGGRIGT